MAHNTTYEKEEIASFLNADISGESTPATPSVAADKDPFDLLLDEFLANQLQDVEDTQEELLSAIESKRPQNQAETAERETAQQLYQEEHRLYEAYQNFTASVIAMADQANLPHPEFGFNAKEIYLRYRPNRGTGLNQDIVNAWNLMLEAQPIRLANIPANASDEQLLEYAEKTTDENLQMALISYVEILIELESCEISYNIRKAKAKKRKIERAIYEEHQQRLETMRRFIEAIKVKNFPIDAERLVNNYFKTARKDPDAAKKILESNPATYAPIDISKIPARFFGFIKPKPEDGIRINKEIGKFLKTLKA